MKLIILMLVIICIPVPLWAECIEYKIIEHADSIEAICIGAPQKHRAAQAPKWRVDSTIVMQSDGTKKLSTINSCKMLLANH